MKHSIFFDFFPPPLFLQMPSAGMDISDDAVRFVYFIQTHHKNQRSIKIAGERLLPEGVVERGVIKKSKELKEIIKSIKEDHKSLEFVRVSLPEEESYLFSVQIPKVSQDEIKDVVSSRLEEFIPIKSSEATFDYRVLSVANDKLGVEVSVVSNTVVVSYSNVFENTGLIPIYFEVESKATTRSAVPSEEKGAFAVVDIKKSKTSIYLVVNKVIQMSSSVGIGAKDLTVHGGQILDDSKEAVAGLKDEIEKRCRYWDTHKSKGNGHSSEIEGVILCGEGASIKGLPNYLRSHLARSVSKANPWINVIDFDHYVPPLTLDDSLRYAVAIGLATPFN